jgi:hypothetical protein
MLCLKHFRSNIKLQAVKITSRNGTYSGSWDPLMKFWKIIEDHQKTFCLHRLDLLAFTILDIKTKFKNTISFKYNNENTLQINIHNIMFWNKTEYMYKYGDNSGTVLQFCKCL